MRWKTRCRWFIRRVQMELHYYRLLLADPRTPRLSKWLLGAALLYLISPVDVLPDFLPLVGQLDDLVIVPLLVYLAIRLIPAQVKQDCRQRFASHAVAV